MPNRGGRRAYPRSPHIRIGSATQAESQERFLTCVRCEKTRKPQAFVQHPEVEGIFCNDCYAVMVSDWAVQANRAGVLDSKYQRIYGISLEDYGRMFTRQGGSCAICRCPQSESGAHGILVVDHDHDTGRVRGLLCQKCNAGLGMFADSVTSLARAIIYLED